MDEESKEAKHHKHIYGGAPREHDQLRDATPTSENTAQLLPDLMGGKAIIFWVEAAQSLA